ncbi:MAG: hypothetical protein QXX08_04060 [Candidatus Bathyarchaeia archaeon]
MVEACPFCGNDYYSISKPVCQGCGGEIRGRMYCPNCGGFHIFTVKEPRVGCWCCNRIYNSWREYDEYKKNGLRPELKEINAISKQSSLRRTEKKEVISQVKQESKRPDEEEMTLKKDLNIEEENLFSEEELAEDVDVSGILNCLERISRLLPKLEEKREYFNKQRRQIEGKISEVEESILKLKEERNNLHDEIRRIEGEAAKIAKIRSVMQRIAEENKLILTATS